ncbi:LysR substrate-binding domain-containing protein [Dyella psychrodurans]|uniref:LysR family transcriptional regulator n=1 Tax=Dyella psychrodurans TaxID=1927960 RepID=A0A370XD66_9GAMM|nr:LysR substrate-binding domain-containing protein [Dyella psychrodurans]RDS86329.1 LysR family transcriptional regulator [Dyella psychrodurans]
MELRQLQHFVVLAEEQHFTRAARRVNIVQSALSTSIRQLEAELDAQLVVRNTRQVRLTTVGKIFLNKAKAALEAINDARETVAAIQGLKHGTLSIGTVQSLPAFLDLPSLIEQFHVRHPDVEVRLCQGSASALLEKVRSGKLDLAVLPLSEPPADVHTTMIACDALVLACAPNHPLTGRTDVPWSALRGQPFVDFEQDWGTRKLIDRGFLEAGIDRHIAFEVSDLDTLVELVRRGLGVALLPEAAARTRLPAIGMAELAGPELCWELVVAYVGDHSEEPMPVDHAPRVFFELLRNTNMMPT